VVCDALRKAPGARSPVRDIAFDAHPSLGTPRTLSGQSMLCALMYFLHRHGQGKGEYLRINSRTRHTFVPSTQRAPKPPMA
jgi:hypothetical protein